MQYSNSIVCLSWPLHKHGRRVHSASIEELDLPSTPAFYVLGMQFTASYRFSLNPVSSVKTEEARREEAAVHRANPLEWNLYRTIFLVAAQLEVEMGSRGTVEGPRHAVVSRQKIYVHAPTLARMSCVGAMHNEGAIFEAKVWLGTSNPSPQMSSDNLEYQRLSYATDMVAAVTFGIYVTLAAICIHFLLQRRTAGRSHRVILWYTVTLLLTGTTWFISGTWFGELELVELPSRVIGQFDSPMSPLYTRVTLVKNVMYTVNIYLADSLLVYRLFIIWGRSVQITVIPGLVWLGVVCTSITALVLTSRPNANFQSPSVVNPETAFICLSISLSILCSLLIAGRLIVQQQAAKKIWCTSTKAYTSVVVVVVESAALYSLFGIIYIPLMVLQSPVQFPFSSLVGTLTLIAPNLIILRIALNSAASPARDVYKGATLPEISMFNEAAAQGIITGIESGVSQATVTESRMAADTYNSVATTETINDRGGRSAQDQEKGMVKGGGGGVWAVVM